MFLSKMDYSKTESVFQFDAKHSKINSKYTVPEINTHKRKNDFYSSLNPRSKIRANEKVFH